MNPIQTKRARRTRRSAHVRARIRRESALPRLSVFRSLKHISAQLIDDRSGRTLCSVTTSKGSLASELKGKTKTQRAAHVGSEIARLAQQAGIKAVVFDRGFARFHGRVKALAEAARAGGLQF
jgi:large subunit ribosomal protein L18